MSIPRKPLTEKQPPAKIDRPTDSSKGHSALQNVVRVGQGPGQTWFGLTREDVDEKVEKYRQQHSAKEHRSLWQRLWSVFGRQGKAG